MGKQRLARCIQQDSYDWVQYPTLHRYGIEMFFHLIDPANRCHLILPFHLCLDSSRCDKDPRTVLPKNLHQGAIVKLGNYARMDALLVQPLINAGSQLATATMQQ